MKFVHFFRGKLAVAAIAGMIIVGGATAAFAATPAGRNLVHTLSSQAHTKATANADNHAGNAAAHKGHAHHGKESTCPGFPDAQRLAGQFALSTASTSGAIQAICSLHQGTFTGTTPGGAAVASSRVFGYGEIDQLLTYAQFLASHDQANASGKLTSANAQSYLAEANQSCGTMPLATCLQMRIPGFQLGNGRETPMVSLEVRRS